MNRNTYAEEMYDYLTDPVNYRSALDLAQNVRTVNDRLKTEFWELVTDELKSKVENYQYNNEGYLSFRKEGWFKIEKDPWEYYIVIGETRVIEVVLREDKEKRGLKEEFIKETLNAYNKQKKAKKIGDYKDIGHICKKELDLLPFQKKEEYIEGILPAVRNKEVEKIADEYFSYIKDLIIFCDSINKYIIYHKND